MLRQRTRSLQAAVALSDAAATALAFFAAYYAAGPFLQRWASLRVVLPIEKYLWLLLAAVPMWWIILGLFGCYDFSPIERLSGSLRRMAVPLTLGALAMGAATFFSKEPDFSRRVVGAFLLGNVILLLVGRALVLKAAPRFYRATGAMRRVLIVGVDEAARGFAKAVQRAGWGLEFAGFVAFAEPADGRLPEDYVGAVSDLARILDARGVDDLVLAEASAGLETVQQVIRTCEEVGVVLHIPSHFFSAALSRPHLETFSGIRMLTFSATPYNPVALGIKRVFDIVGAAILGILLALPMALIALLVRITSPGPVIFRQRRSGLYGREFTMYKFRSMTHDAEQRRGALESANEMAGPVFKMRQDPRVTRVGRVIRKYSLDELPQLWNVLKGDMSLIGPRPPLPAEVRRYERWQRRRLSMRPGLTCIWQVTDRNRATFEKWMEYDLHYIDHWSLWLDARIAVQTVPAILRGTGV